jgi:hypothetical protein
VSKAAPAQVPRKAAAKKSAPKPAAAETPAVLHLTPPEAGAEPDIDLTAEPGAPEPPPKRRAKWAGYALDRPRQHLTSVETITEDA